MSRGITSPGMVYSMPAEERAEAARWREQKLPISTATALAHKERERAQLQCHMDAFLKRKGRIQVLPTTPAREGPQSAALQEHLAKRAKGRRAQAKARQQDEEE